MLDCNYETLETQGEQFYQAGKYDAFIALYKNNLENFPDHLPEMIHDLALVYLAKGDKTNALAFLSAGLERGFFFGLPEWGAFVQQFGEDSKFGKLRAYNQKLQNIARQSAQPQWTVELPNEYDALGSYPLFITLHGYGENIQVMQRFWQSSILREKFIHAYLQSSQVVDLKNFSWDDNPLARQEVLQVVSEITDHHFVQLDKIFIGGFSQGGTLSIDLSITQILPIRGFIALCAQKPDSFTTEALKNLQDINVKGVILTGENDPSLDVQKEMIREFEQAHFPHRFSITPGLGHWFPDDLSTKLDDALDYLLGE